MTVDGGQSGQPVALVVDDDERSRQLLGLLLAADGYRVRSAASGAEALAIVAAGAPVHVVLVDLVMPGMDGMETCRRLRATTGGRLLPLLVVSGMDDPAAFAGARQAGADEFVVKPIDRGELRSTLARLLATRAATPTGPDA